MKRQSYIEYLIENYNIARDTIVKNYIIKHVNTFVASNTDYQIIIDSWWWRSIHLRYGNNIKEEESFQSFLKRIIRSQQVL